MFLRSITNRGVQVALRRGLSTESPKMTIAKNYLLLKELSSATTETELADKFANPPAADMALMPAELTSYFSTAATSSAEPYIPDPTAWQNMPFWQYAGEEVKRAQTWPFLVGLM